jgi:hypothetical protein
LRDDFGYAIKNTLAARVGYCCSNPDCRAATNGPQADEQKALNIGVAAHIVAAAQGGPRFDPTLTSKQRASIINGIWLCQNCAHNIDADETRYSIARLYHWKLGAEHAAHENIGKPRTSPPPIGPGSHVPQETMRVVQQKNESWWSDGSSGTKPIMLVYFAGSITEIAGKQIRVVAAELSEPPQPAGTVEICNGHNCQRPQFLRPHETADLLVTFIISPVSNLEADGTWRSSITLIDQFGNRHELLDCVFKSDPMR